MRIALVLLVLVLSRSVGAGGPSAATVEIRDATVVGDGCHGTSCKAHRIPSSILCRWEHQSASPEGENLAVDAPYTQPVVGVTLPILVLPSDDVVESSEVKILQELFDDAVGGWRCATSAADETAPPASYQPPGEYRHENTELSCSPCLADASENVLNFSRVELLVTFPHGTPPAHVCALCRLDYDLVYYSPVRHQVGLGVLLSALLVFVGVMMWTMISGAYRRNIMSSHVTKKFDDLQQWVSERDDRPPRAAGSVRRRQLTALDALDVGSAGGEETFPSAIAGSQELFDQLVSGRAEYGSGRAAVAVARDESSYRSGLPSGPTGDTFPIDGAL